MTTLDPKALEAAKAAFYDTPVHAGALYLSHGAQIEKAITAYLAALPAQPVAFQQRVDPWMQACFGPEISKDKLERGDRALEEMLELLQSGEYPAERVAALTAYVYGRPKGEPHQEVGGVMVTLAAYCLAHDLDMQQAGEDELARIWTKVDKIRAKQAAKPTGSALPVALAAPSQQEGVTKTLDEWSEDDGDVLWWCWRDGEWLGEAAWIGTPLDLGRGYRLSIGDQDFVVNLGGWPGYHTHWTPHPAHPRAPEPSP